MAATTVKHPPYSIHPPQRFLFGPGPTQVDPRVYEAMSRPIVGHLDPVLLPDQQRSAAHVAGSVRHEQ
jgi:alanine-glyoxylate transaminase/serine-glyoxylate transaminase/serine-pyruvate transaminase